MKHSQPLGSAFARASAFCAPPRIRYRHPEGVRTNVFTVFGYSHTSIILVSFFLFFYFFTIIYLRVYYFRINVTIFTGRFIPTRRAHAIPRINDAVRVIVTTTTTLTPLRTGCSETTKFRTSFSPYPLDFSEFLHSRIDSIHNERVRGYFGKYVARRFIFKQRPLIPHSERSVWFLQ